jgi:hypothetical protein
VPLAFHSGREADHSSPSGAEVAEWVELYLHSPNAPSWCGAQLGGAQGQLYLLPLPNGVRLRPQIDGLSHVWMITKCGYISIQQVILVSMKALSLMNGGKPWYVPLSVVGPVTSFEPGTFRNRANTHCFQDVQQ